jgi:hypothetical protein
MLPPGHAAGGYLTGVLFAHLFNSDPKETKLLHFLGVAGGLLPDLDLPAHLLLEKVAAVKPDIQHHTWFSHTYPFFLIPGGLLIWWARRSGRHRLAKGAAVVTAATCTHLTQDMIGTGDGVQLLFPFSKRMFGFRLFGVHGREWSRRYRRDPIFAVEITFVLVALLVFLYRLGKLSPK